MTTLYLIRHCEAQGNSLGTVQGRTDSDITAKGKLQLEALASVSQNLKIHAVYSSNLKRAIATAKAVNTTYNHEIIIDKEITEIDFGDWEGMYWEDVRKTYEPQYIAWKDSMHEFQMTNGESVVEVYERMIHACTNIAKQNAGKTVAIASHGCAIRTFLCYVKFGDIQKIQDIGWLENTSISRVDFDEDFNPSLIFEGKCDFLSDELKSDMNREWRK